LNQYNQRRTPPPSNSGATRPNTRPNPSLQPRKPVTTYRARSTTSALPEGQEPRKNSTADRATAVIRAKTRRRKVRTILFVIGALVVLAAGGAWMWASSAITTISRTIEDISQTPVAQRPGPDNGTPVPVTFPDWSKKEPVNILLLGLDLRAEDDETDTRADTQIVIHIDPVAKSATMFSIPRDLWVPIPGYGEGRINTAYQLGESHKDEILGGGPSLAMATIEQNFGIPMHYFAQVDFHGFERVVDAMGGVTVDVPRPLVDNEYPYQSYGVTRIYVPAGLQHMDGRTALQYARSRHADSDLGRNSRQQQVLLALRQQGINLNLITRLNEIAARVRDAIRTDLSVTQVGSLALLAKDIGSENIQTVLLEPPCVNQTILASGADVLLPDWDCIRPKVAQALSDPRLSKEAARLSVKNGTQTSGVARKVYDKLLPKGFLIPDLSSAENQGQHPVTTITDYTGGQKPRTIEVLAEELDIDPANILQADPAEAPIANSDGKPVDILVLVGDDKIE
jgi:LCP family protein required for cell wall assembly